MKRATEGGGSAARPWAAGLLAAAALAAAGCRGGDGQSAPAPAKVTKVEVLRLEPAGVEDWLELPGAVEPAQEITVGTEVGGRLEWRGGDEGEPVRRGERLALVDRERLALAERQGALALEQARSGAERMRLGVEQARQAAAIARAHVTQAASGVTQATELEKKARAVRDRAVADRDRARALFEERLAPRSYLEGFETALAAAEADLAGAAGGVEAAQAARAAAETAVESAATALAAAEADHLSARSRIESAEAALEEARLWLRRSEILSPIDGFVSRVFHEPGEVVEANKPLYTLVATARVTAVFALPERDASLVSPGAPAAVVVASGSPEALPGKVTRIGVVTDPATSTYRLEVELPNPAGRIRPGMLAKLRLRRGSRSGAIAVPLFAVLHGAGGAHVFLFEDGTARRREVATGIVDGERVEIRGGLAAGELLIVKGQRELEDGQKVSLP